VKQLVNGSIASIPMKNDIKTMAITKKYHENHRKELILNPCP
jgi:hypothetical protein